MSTSLSVAPLFSSDYYQNPYPTWAWLRAHSPVHEFRFPIGNVRMWMVTRYDDVRAVLADDRFSTEGATWGNTEFQASGLVTGAGSLMERVISVIDPPEHTRIRRLAMSSFTPREMKRWQQTANDVVSSALNRCAQRGTFDVMDDFAGLVASEVLARILGFPPERRAEFSRLVALAFTADPELMPGVPNAWKTMCDHARELVAEKRENPSDDLTSAFVAARDVDDRLTEDELMALVAVIVFSGADTIRALLGNAILALLDHPDQARLLRARPDLTANAIEELIRYEGAGSVAMIRVTKEELEFAGTTIPAGAPVMVGILSANRDPAVYDDPDRLDITRRGARHVGLGHGIHNCLGAALVRLETEAAVPAFFHRFPDIALAVPREELRYDQTWLNRRLTRLPVSIEPVG